MEKVERKYIHTCNKIQHMFVDNAYCNVQSNCRDCTPIDYKSSPNERKSLMFENAKVESGNGLSEMVFLSELKKLNDSLKNDVASLKSLVEIIGRENKDAYAKLERMLQRPNVLNTATLATKETSKETSKESSDEFAAYIKELSEKYPNANFKLFLGDVWKKFPEGFETEEKAIEGLRAIYGQGYVSIGKSKYFPSRPSKELIPILAKHFVGGKKTDNAVCLDKSKSEYWLTAFSGHIDKATLQKVIALIKEKIKRSELSKGIKGQYVWPKQGRDYLDKEFATVKEVYPEKEYLEFLSYLGNYAT